MPRKPSLSLWKVLLLTLASGAVASAAVPVHAQLLAPNGREEITIEASTDSVYRNRSQRPYSVLRPQVLSVSRPVSYADLTLSKPTDAAELQRRIEETADNLCRELGWRVAHGHFDIGYYDRGVHRNCVKVTIEKAIATAKSAIADFG